MVHTFPKGICPKVNVIARLEYELAYYDSAVYRFNHYTTRIPPAELVEYAADIYIKVKVNLAPHLIEGDPKAPFSIATTPRSRGGRYSFPWITPFYP